MGTSSARKAPVGKFWRTAKTAAARFASGKEGSPPTAREVVARYLTALVSEAREGGENFLPVTVEAAASLGKFYRQWEQEGWEAALQSLGLDSGNASTKTDLLPALLDKLSGPGARLEEAVARAALIDHLAPVLGVYEKSPPPQSADLQPVSGLFKVCDFLGLALYRTLLSDLGESLEFHAPSATLVKQRQEEIRTHILGSIQALKPAEEVAVSFTSEQMGAFVDRILSRLGGRHER